MNFRFREIIFAIFLLTCVKHICPAQEISKDVYNISSNEHSLVTDIDPDFKPRLGTYHYKATWQNAEAATAIMSVTIKDGHYVIDAHFKLKDAIKRLYQLSYKGSAKIVRSDFAPSEAELYERKGEKRYTTNIKFKDDNVIESVRVKTIDKKNPQTKVRSIVSAGSTFDPFATAFLARSLKWEPNKSQEFEIYNGKHKFLLKLNCLRHKTIELSEKKHDVWVLSASVKELDEPDAKMEDTGLLIFLTTNRARDILLVKGDAAIGTVRLEMEDFIPLSPVELRKLWENN